MTSAATLRPSAAARRAAPAASPQRGAKLNWIQGFILLQILCQLILLTSLAAGPFRVVIRIAAFAISLLFLMFLPGRGAPHPASKPAIVVMVLVALSLFHPTTNNMVSGLAQIALYLAILAPLFWVPRLALDLKAFRTVLLTLWAFHILSATFGILQVYYPGRFEPNVSTVLAAKGPAYLKAMSMTVAGGQRVMRPMGLTDTPGGAGIAGFYTVLLGLGFLLTERRFLYRCFFVASMFLGMTCLYLCQIRALVVMLACCVITLFIMLAWRGSTMKLTLLATVVASVVLLSFLWAVSMGGTAISKRFATITSDNPTNTYYKSRGIFLEYTINELLPKYPLGAGLGRWGMTNSYFGDHDKPMIWAEIQWTGWLLDGGIPLILAYVVTLAFAFRTVLKIALGRARGDLWFWGAVLLAYNLGALALTFSYPFFISQSGMEFWMLNAVLFAVAQSAPATEWILVRRVVPSEPAEPATVQSFPDANSRSPRSVSGRGLRPNRGYGQGQFRPGPLSR